MLCLHGHAAVDRQDLACDVRGIVACKKCHGLCDVVNGADPSQWYHLFGGFNDGLGQFFCHFGFDEAGRYAVGCYVLFRQLTSNRFCHANEAGFACGIVCLAGVAHNAGHRADTDDATKLVSDHRPCGCAGCDKGCAEIYFDNLIEFLIAHAKEQVVTCDAGVVYQDAYAFVFGGQRFEDLDEFGGIRNINTFCDNGEAGFLDDGFELCKLVIDYVEACDDTALLSSSRTLARPMPLAAPVTTASLFSDIYLVSWLAG